MKEVFPDTIHLSDAGMIGGSRIFKLEKPYRFYSSKGLIIIPVGFITDGASIPKVFHNILNPYGKYFASALCHDYFYSPLNQQFARKESDDLFLEGMEVLGVNWITRNVIYYAVRGFGWRFYDGFKD
jgi:hypothetical protein